MLLLIVGLLIGAIFGFVAGIASVAGKVDDG